MRIAVLTVRLHAPWVHSLKEKRMVVKSLLSRIRNKFNVSAAEIDEQDTHQILVLGFAAVAANAAQADSILENVQHFIEANTDAQIVSLHTETI